MDRPNRPYRPITADSPMKTGRFCGTVGQWSVPNSGGNTAENGGKHPDLGRLGR